jgi:hypothetical protein
VCCINSDQFYIYIRQNHYAELGSHENIVSTLCTLIFYSVQYNSVMYAHVSSLQVVRQILYSCPHVSYAMCAARHVRLVLYVNILIS